MRIFARLLWLPLIALALWAGWWVLGSEAQEQAIARWFEERRADGWQAEYTALDVTGFPDRFERRVEGLRVTDPEHGWSLDAPWIASASRTWGINRFDVSAAPAFRVAVPGEQVRVSTDTNRFELGVAADPSMPLRDATLTLAGLRIDAADWQAAASRLEARLAERSEEAGPANSYGLTVEAEDLVMPETLLSELDPTGRLAPELERLRLDAHAALDHALDRDFVEEAELSARTIVIRRAAVQWGEMALDASGRLDADENGLAEGKIALGVTNWRQMVRMAEESGAIGPEVGRAIEAALGLASLFGSRDGALDVSLRFEDGRISIGPVTIGDAPRIAFPPRERDSGA